MLGDFEVPGVDWFEAVEKACDQALKTKALITVRSKRSSDDVSFVTNVFHVTHHRYRAPFDSLFLQ